MVEYMGKEHFCLLRFEYNQQNSWHQTLSDVSCLKTATHFQCNIIKNITVKDKWLAGTTI